MNKSNFCRKIEAVKLDLLDGKVSVEEMNSRRRQLIILKHFKLQNLLAVEAEEAKKPKVRNRHFETIIYE